jgi:hypothetical protein
LIINKKEKKVTRLDPSPGRKAKIFNKNVNKGLNDFFKNYGFKFIGFSKKSKIIKHGGMCRFATPLLYTHGKKLTHRILKKTVLNYLKYLLLAKCSKRFWNIPDEYSK